MKLLKRLSITLSIMLMVGITGCVYFCFLPKGPPITEVQPLQTAVDSFVMYASPLSNRKTIKVFTYWPTTWKSGDPVLFVMHGAGRDAHDYLQAWIHSAKEQNMLIVAPEFENKFSRYTLNDYQAGNLFTALGIKNKKEVWAFTVVENVFDHLLSNYDISNGSYDIFGHSAGGQFVHRMVLMYPEARIRRAIAANAGFYTFPDETVKYPYGLKRTPVHKESLATSFNMELFVLLGELDNNSSSGRFIATKKAKIQGQHRLERGTNFYQACRTAARNMAVPFNWSIDTVPNVGHDFQQMSTFAAEILKN